MKILIEVNLDEGAWCEDFARRNGTVATPDDVIDTLVEAIKDWSRPAKVMISIPLT